MPKKLRLDQLVIERALFASREMARTAIMDGAVLVNGEKCTKPGFAVSDSALVEFIPSYVEQKFVSRGGLKLERALDQFNISVEKRVCLDIGASTGGFTDCLLSRGAALVYAIDVGYGQLDWRLRQDSRVIVKERLNARYLNNEIYGADRQRASFVVMDVSFISITKILPALIDMCGSDASLEIVSLVKPQFEAGRELLGKGGVIRSAETHLRVLESIDRFVRSQDMGISGWTHSPVKGPAGNIEFLARLLINPDLFAKETDSIDAGLDIKLDLECVVQEAHEALNRKG